MSLCFQYVKGTCPLGDECPNSHPPVCKKFLQRRCSLGNKCTGLHFNCEVATDKNDRLIMDFTEPEHPEPPYVDPQTSTDVVAFLLDTSLHIPGHDFNAFKHVLSKLVGELDESTKASLFTNSNWLIERLSLTEPSVHGFDEVLSELPQNLGSMILESMMSVMNQRKTYEREIGPVSTFKLVVFTDGRDTLSNCDLKALCERVRESGVSNFRLEVFVPGDTSEFDELELLCEPSHCTLRNVHDLT